MALYHVKPIQPDVPDQSGPAGARHHSELPLFKEDTELTAAEQQKILTGFAFALVMMCLCRTRSEELT